MARSILHAAMHVTSTLAIAASAMLLACGSVQAPDATPPIETDDGSSYWPSAEWRRARPQDVGLDPTRITTLVSRLRANQPGGIHSLVVVRHGYVVTEEYFNGSSATVVHTMQSVSKSVTSLLVGIAAERDGLSVTRAVVDYFPEYANLQHLDGRKRALTAQHLLEMRTGMDFWENPYPGSPLQQLNDSRDDWVRFVLDRPMVADPGTTWAYNSGGVIALAGVLRTVTGERPDAFARRVLFDPIGARSPRWYTSPFDALPHTGGGLNLTALDLARVGYLVLRNGRWGDQQIVSADWLRESLRPITRSTAGWAGRAFDYGRLWWMTALDGSGATEDPQRVVWTAAGSGGQFLFVIPRHDLVVAVTASAADFASPVRFLFDDIIASVR